MARDSQCIIRIMSFALKFIYLVNNTRLKGVVGGRVGGGPRIGVSSASMQSQPFAMRNSPERELKLAFRVACCRSTCCYVRCPSHRTLMFISH